MPSSRTSTGSVYQRQSDGKWCAAVSVAGRRIVRYGASEREAKQALQKMLREHFAGKLAPPSKMTTGQWIEQWLDRGAADWRASTQRTYAEVLSPVVAEIGHARLDKLDPATLATLFARLRKNGMGGRRVQSAFTRLRTCLTQAVDLGVIGANPLDRVSAPKWTPQQRSYWTLEECRRFVATAETSATKWAPLWLVLVTGGLRISEAIAVTWRDLDLHAGTLRVERAIVWSGQKATPGPVKTRSALRVIVLPQCAVRALAALPRPIDSGLPVFRLESGEPPNPQHLRYPLKRLCRQAGVPELGLHDLRHVAAAVAVAVSRDPHVARQRLGHSSLAMTLSVYSYRTANDGDVASAIDALISARAPHEAAERA